MIGETKEKLQKGLITLPSSLLAEPTKWSGLWNMGGGLTTVPGDFLLTQPPLWL